MCAMNVRTGATALWTRPACESPFAGGIRRSNVSSKARSNDRSWPAPARCRTSRSTPSDHPILHIAAIQTARIPAPTFKKRPPDWTCVIPPGGGTRCRSAFALFRVPGRTVIAPLTMVTPLPFVTVPIAAPVPVTVPVPSGRHDDHRCRCDHDGRRYANIDADRNVGGIRKS